MKKIRKTLRSTAAIVVSLILSGCTSTIHKTTSIDGIQTLSIDAKQRLVLVNPNGGPDKNSRIACAEPSPDALVAQAAALSANIDTPKDISAALSAANSESAGSIGLRTQSIQILRDGYFRICEAYMNGSIDGQQYEHVINNVDSVIAVVLAIDTLGGTVTAPALGLAPGTTTNVSADGTNANSHAGDIKIENFNAERGALSDAQAKAIENIAIKYMQYVGSRNAAYANLKYQNYK